MMGKRIFMLTLLGLGLAWVLHPQPATAANIHLRYFEAADVLLGEEQFQLFSISALQDEQITVVAYGLEEGVTPSIAFFDRDGLTMVEDRNLDGLSAASIQAVIPANCIYTFLVSRTSQQSGLVRVMVFTGDPLDGNSSFLDTIDPFLPNRAFLVAGDSADPIEVSLDVVEDASPDGAGVYASRGTQLAPPPLDERTTPRRNISWENDDEALFYTVHVSFYPETLPTSQKLGAQLSRMSQALGTSTIQVDVARRITLAESAAPGVVATEIAPTFFSRPICDAVVTVESPWLAGPSPQYKQLGEKNLEIGRELEIIGELGDYYQVVNTNNPSGDGWVLKAVLELGSEATGTDCSRVQPVMAPPLTDQNRRG